jgi:hypothetical protein
MAVAVEAQHELRRGKGDRALRQHHQEGEQLSGHHALQQYNKFFHGWFLPIRMS